MTATTVLIKSVDLVKREPAKKLARFYLLEIWSDLFGGFTLAREYGRIRQGGRLYITPFDEEQAACQAFERLFRQKTRKGYVPGVREA
jgi:predicted DNA-binding WGR domain protein